MNTNITKLLSVLNYPNYFDSCLDRRKFIQCVNWLEDRKIRELEIADRERLRNETNQFDDAFTSYLDRLGCPFEHNAADPSETLLWLVSHAVSVEYEDCSESCLNSEERTNEEIVVINHADMSSNKELTEQVEKLGSLVKVRRNFEEDIPDYLGRINKTIRFVLAPLSSEAAVPNALDDLKTTEFSPGFDSDNELINQISVVLKMLYLWDFRELQTDLNALIVLGQEYTANPKTNTALGKVGR